MTSAMFQSVWIVLILVGGGCCQDEIQSKFVEERLCDVDERILRGCSSEVNGVRSHLECMTMCGEDNSCVGASLDNDGLCFHHKECPLISNCTVEDGGHRHMTKYCRHGTWDPKGQSCKCVDGFYGERCHQCHPTCREFFDAGNDYKYKIIYIDPDYGGQKPFRVNCYKATNGFVAVFVFENKGVFDFNKTWTDYVNGFLMAEDDYWYGLYAMHRLTKAGLNNFKFALRFLANGGFKMRLYRGFSVSDETNGYRFTLQSSIASKGGFGLAGSSFGDCLGPLQNVPFSTRDLDNDGDSSDNCAARAGSGWWYSGCDNPCNALGLGPQYQDTVPSYRLFSLLGADMTLASESHIPVFQGYFEN